MAERGLLQGFERHELGALALTFRARLLEARLDGDLLGPQALHDFERASERVRQLFAREARLRFAFREDGQLLVGTLRGERFALDREAIRLRHEPAQLVLKLLDAS